MITTSAGAKPLTPSKSGSVRCGSVSGPRSPVYSSVAPVSLSVRCTAQEPSTCATGISDTVMLVSGIRNGWRGSMIRSTSSLSTALISRVS